MPGDVLFAGGFLFVPGFDPVLPEVTGKDAAGSWLSGTSLLGFQFRDSLVECEGLLDQFQPLNEILVADAIDFLCRLNSLTYGCQLTSDFSQLGRDDVLQYLTDIFDKSHRTPCLSQEFYTH
jgi:hypothetical protein